MAKCDLLIELDEPDRVFLAGEMVKGCVRVSVDSGVNCSGLVVSSGWKTHGRGNVTSGEGEQTTVFSGEWAAGQPQEYKFSLPAGDWPPTYHGHLLSIDHYIDARAKIPWAFDPKASSPFMVRATEASAECSPLAQASANLTILIVALVLLAVVPGGMAVASGLGWFGFLFVLVSIATIVAFVFFRKFLPTYMLGNPAALIQEDTLALGDEVVGEFVTTTKKNVSINSITAVLTCMEKCVSGSGSNKTTHTHAVFEKSLELQSKTVLKVGQEHRLPFVFRVPDDAPCSVKLHQNSLIWSVELRVDIPRWPDWVKSLNLFVGPSNDQSAESKVSAGQQQNGSVDVNDQNRMDRDPQATSSGSSTAGELTFAETVSQLWAVRQDHEQVEMVVEAVTGISFDVEAEVERRLLYGGDEDPHVYKDGYAVWARYPDPRLPLVLYVPHELGDEFEQLGRNKWRGKGAIVGWDSLHGRVQIRLEPPM